MKLLLVFVSALVLVVHCNVVPQVDHGPQDIFAEETPAVSMYSAEDEPNSLQEPQGAHVAEYPAVGKLTAFISCSNIHVVFFFFLISRS